MHYFDNELNFISTPFLTNCRILLFQDGAGHLLETWKLIIMLAIKPCTGEITFMLKNNMTDSVNVKLIELRRTVSGSNGLGELSSLQGKNRNFIFCIAKTVTSCGNLRFHKNSGIDFAPPHIGKNSYGSNVVY